MAYVGFGTVPTFAPTLAEVAAAVRSCVANGLRTVVTTTDPELRSALVSTHGADVEIQTFVRLDELLPMCRVVVSHGGAGTVLAALSAGVPLVLCPKMAPSQLRMSTACEHAELARVVSPDDGPAMEHAVDEVLTDERFGRRASDAADQIASMPHPDQLVAVLEAALR